MRRGNSAFVTFSAASLIATGFVGSPQSAFADRWYVNGNVASSGNGGSWQSPLKYLTDALAVAVGGDEVWVAGNLTYYADESDANPSGTGSVTSTFNIPNGVQVYGGFAATEIDLLQRNPEQIITTLSADLDSNGVLDAPNAYHVVSMLGVNDSTKLSGFHVTMGRAVGSGDDVYGGGLFIRNDASPNVTRCMMHKNFAQGSGGGADVRIDDPALPGPLFVNDRFVGNQAFGGGGMNIGVIEWPGEDAKIALVNTEFSGNIAFGFNGLGGAILKHGRSIPTLRNCAIAYNHAIGTQDFSFTGGIHYSTGWFTNIHNCVLWGNTSTSTIQTVVDQQLAIGTDSLVNMQFTCIQDSNPSDTSIPFGGAANGNIDDNPLFCDTDGADDVQGTLDDSFRLQSTSPCIDKGSNTLVLVDSSDLDDDGNTTETLPWDVTTQSRIVQVTAPTARVDMGANEFPGASDCPGDLDGDGDVDGNDLAMLLADWGVCGGPCPADLVCSGSVDGEDLAELLAQWGDCPGGSAAASSTSSTGGGFVLTPEFIEWILQASFDEILDWYLQWPEGGDPTM